MKLRTAFFLVLLALSLAAYGNDPATHRPIVEEAVSLGLDTDPVWLRLLHYESAEADTRSLIRSPEFFLAKNGQTSARDELAATLEAYFQEIGNVDEHPRCRFPARYFWLSTKMTLPGPDIHCTRLENWAKFEQLDSVSLMMISGYFGNPASTFGHILMKINNGSIPTEHSLLDLGINYGALVPEEEATFTYIMRGLFGGYEAGFSDQDYYRYDLTYSRTEFRDMWEYELALSDHQIRLLLYHLWEISGKKFRYFFIKSNCAYRLAELLELVTENDFVSDVNMWYAPISVFHRLRQVDADNTPKKRLISSVTFVPSAQRVLYAQLDNIEPAELQVINSIIESNGDLSPINSLPEGRQSRVMDALLSYYQYLLAGIPEDEDSEWRAVRDEAIVRRLTYPPTLEREEIVIPGRRPPSLGAAPSLFGIGGGYDDVTDSYAMINYSPFRYDGVGNNALEKSSLVVFDLTIAFDSDDELRLDHLDVIRARKVNLNTVDIGNESKRSWEVAAGVRRERNGCGHCSEAFVDGSVGRAGAITNRLTGMASVGASLSTGEFGPSVNSGVTLMFGSGGNWAGELDVTYRYFPREGEDRVVSTLRNRFSVSQHHEIRLEFSDNEGVNGRIYYAYHW